MDLKLSNDTQTHEEWCAEVQKDPWYNIYVCAYERWESLKNTDPDRASREYESMIVAIQKGQWWRKWNSLLDNMPTEDTCTDCEQPAEQSVVTTEELPAPPETVSEIVKEMFKLV